MKHFEFNYNKNFSCIASACKHNCCIGWQIKIDKRSMKNYQALKQTDGRFSDTAFDGNYFNLVHNRCPFLDGDNLCHVIKNYGDKKLCTTCKTHPRFKNFFTGVTETGLGLYCEHACKIILSSKQKMRLVLVKGDNKPCTLSPFEKKVLAFRKKVIRLLQDNNLTLDQKIQNLTSLANIDLNKFTFKQWTQVFCSLEKLTINDFSFESLCNYQDFAPLVNGFDNEYTQLLCYLAFRHLSRAIDMLDLRVRLAFVLLSFMVINTIFYHTQNKDLDSLVEVCRFYSSEIECNDDNIYTLLNHIESLISFI